MPAAGLRAGVAPAGASSPNYPEAGHYATESYNDLFTLQLSKCFVVLEVTSLADKGAVGSLAMRERHSVTEPATPLYSMQRALYVLVTW